MMHLVLIKCYIERKKVKSKYILGQHKYIYIYIYIYFILVDQYK